MGKLSDFDLDLSVGQAGEKLVEGLLTGNKTIEVKTDLKWKNTNNIYIETECWSHNNQSWYASGLSATKAEYLKVWYLLYQPKYYAKQSSCTGKR
jgi:hypothetical protein